jgi:hypothetical protein
LVNFKWHTVCDGQILAFVASNSSAKRVSGHIVELPRLDFAQVLSQIGISVRL